MKIRTWAQYRRIEAYLERRAKRALLRAAMAQSNSHMEAAALLDMNYGVYHRNKLELEIETPEHFTKKDRLASGRRGNSPCPERDALAKQLSLNGCGLKQAAAKLGVSTTGVLKMEARLGIRFERMLRRPAPKPEAPKPQKSAKPEKTPLELMQEMARKENEKMRAVGKG
jgi:hypothetical protein